MSKTASFCAAMAAAVSLGAQADVVTVGELPAPIQDCIAAGTCTAFLDTHIDTVFGTAINVTRPSSDPAAPPGSLDVSWLLDYRLQVGSGVTETTITPEDETTTSFTPYQGSLWMEAPLLTNSSQSTLLDLYLDRMSPVPQTLDGSSSLQFELFPGFAALGGADYTRTADLGGPSSPVTEGGGMALLNELLVCVECGVDVRLDLVGLRYVDTGNAGELFAEVVPDDARAQVLAYDDDDPFTYSTRSRRWYVQPVPLPASAWLFGSGLLSLYASSRRRRQRA